MNNLASPHIGVVGGGVLGMYVAARLREQGFAVTLLEGAPVVGGLATPARIDRYTWDRFYHVILLSDRHLLGLLDELGLSDRLRWGVTRTGFYTDGKLYSLSNTLEFLMFPPLSFIDKLRLGWTIFYAARVKNWTRLEDVPAAQWLLRWSGKRVFERIWQPLLRSKLGENYRIASAAFIWAIIARMYAARRSGLKREMFGYLDGGYEKILRRFAERLDELGVETVCGARVQQVRDAGTHVEVSFGGGVRRFDRAILTVPTGAIADICPQLTDAERARLRGVVYQGIVCPSLLLKKPLSEYYVTNITESWVPFTGVIEMTALVDRERFGGHSLVYLPRYLTQDDPFWKKPDEEVRAEFTAALHKMYPHLQPSDIVAFEVSRARQVLALSTLGYSRRWMPPVATSLPSVFVITSAQIAAGTLNVNETLAVAAAGLSKLSSLTGAGATVPLQN